MSNQVGYGAILERTTESIGRGKRIIIHKGGTGSGKTYDLIIYCLLVFGVDRPGSVITVVSESRPHLEIGAIRIMQQLLSKTGLGERCEYNISQSRLTMYNGTILEFFSADRIGKALGARRTLLYGNEVNNIKFEVWDELARRSDYVIADFNPTAKFWLEKWLSYQEDYEVINSNYTDNPFLPDVERKKIQRQAEMDENFRRIHIDCEYGVYEGRIFDDWEQIDEFPDVDYWYGLDFGFTNDPTAIIRTARSGENIYLDEVLYRTGLTNADIAGALKSDGYAGQPVICDSAEPKSIEELRRLGINAFSADKGKGSINAGIDFLKQSRVKVTKRSINIIKENRGYSWKTDRAGNKLNIPSDILNHSIDAIRYAYSLQVEPEPVVLSIYDLL